MLERATTDAVRVPVVASLGCLGGVDTRAPLIAATSRAEVDVTLGSGQIVTVPGNRTLTADQAGRVQVRRATLHVDNVVDGFTSKDRTIIDCLRNLLEDEGLAIAGSALRAGQAPT